MMRKGNYFLPYSNERQQSKPPEKEGNATGTESIEMSYDAERSTEG